MKTFFKKTLPVCLLGVVAGLLNGLLGAGGGVALVLGLRRLQKDTPHDPRCVYVSALCVMLPVSLFTVFRYRNMGHLETVRIAQIALPAVAGGVLGAWLLRHLTPTTLSRLFSALVLVSGIIMLL